MLLAPFAPYLAHELWEMLGEKGNLLKAPGRNTTPHSPKEEEIEIPVQINGKLRGRIVVPADATEETFSNARWPTKKYKPQSPASKS